MAGWPSGSGSANALRGVPVDTTAPTTGQVLAYDGAKWTPSSDVDVSGMTQLTGDVTAGPGTGSQAATVAALQGRAVATTAPTSGQYLGWTGSQWAPSTPPDTGITQLTGDVTTASGSGSQAATVAKIQGRAVSSTAPTSGQALAWVTASSQWAPTTITATGSASGDLSGTFPAPTVAQIQGRAVNSTAPTSGQGLVWNGSAWAPASVVQAGAFSSSGLTGGANAVPFFAANGAATTLAAPVSKTNQVLGWDSSGNLAWVAQMASVMLFAGSQYVTDTYIVERYDVALEAPNGIVTLDGTGINTATGIV